jgi:alkyl hydroperoxide reductase subunit F
MANDQRPATDDQRPTVDPDVQIYSLEWCPYCIKAKALLRAKDIPYRETDVTDDRESALEMIDRSGRNGVPQIFVNGEHVGGYGELAHFAATGLLDRAFGREPAELRSVYDVAVIGGGAAGLSASLYASRKGLTTVLISEDVGGQVGVTRDIFNYPGYDYVTGPELSERMIAQIAQNPVEQLLGEYVTGLRLDGRSKVIELESGRHVRAEAVIIASGVTKRRLAVPGEEELEGFGVVYCSTCDGPLYRGKTVAVVGAGNSAFEAALEMNGMASKVYLVTRGELSADQVLRDKVATAHRVEHLPGQSAVEIHGDEKVDGLTIADRRSGEMRRLDVDAVFVEAGLLPNTSFALDLVETNETGEIVVDERGRTGVRGVFAAGDCTTVPDKQIVVAAGDGAKAALSAFEYLVSQR